jgi:hypothetical protein
MNTTSKPSYESKIKIHIKNNQINIISVTPKMIRIDQDHVIFYSIIKFEKDGIIKEQIDCIGGI